MNSGDKQLIIGGVLFLAAIGSTTFLVATGMLDASVFTAIVGAVVGAVAGWLNPAKPPQ